MTLGAKTRERQGRYQPNWNPKCGDCGGEAYLCDRPLHGSFTWAIHCRDNPRHNAFGRASAQELPLATTTREGLKMALYRSKPQQVEALQWTGDNLAGVLDFGGGSVAASLTPDRLPLNLLAGKDGAQEWVPVPIGHWLVHQPDDLTDIWPVDPDYFAAKYDPVSS